MLFLLLFIQCFSEYTQLRRSPCRRRSATAPGRCRRQSPRPESGRLRTPAAPSCGVLAHCGRPGRRLQINTSSLYRRVETRRETQGCCLVHINISTLDAEIQTCKDAVLCTMPVHHYAALQTQKLCCNSTVRRCRRTSNGVKKFESCRGRQKGTWRVQLLLRRRQSDAQICLHAIMLQQYRDRCRG